MYFEAWILLLSFIHVILGYPDGAPERACFYMTPRHTHPHTGQPCLKQMGPAPYRITVSNTTFTAGNPIHVTITGAPFKGFFIIAAEEGSKDWPSGTFSSQDPLKGRTVWCSVRNDAATHSNDRWKDAVTLQWWGPSFSPADMIRFVATVVTNRTTYWTDILGPVMTQGQAAEGAVVEGAGGLFAGTGRDAWGYPTTASWMSNNNNRGGGGVGGMGGAGGGRGFSPNVGGFNNNRGFNSFARGAGGEGPTKPTPTEGGSIWNEQPRRGNSFQGRGGGNAGRGSTNNAFLQMVKSLFGMKK
ncbi:putative defense protein Hdd11-like [Mytilus edulis]|uniref:Reelin domain-containing protein n=2 Tax=Mytilus TaxID=6548 RepID=A0A8B6DW72_MYTGA|nr:unnamed protein product [Mytilus edulis]VDI26070.1 Hypothetical predicted protein [Mytilus galloprovincialis]